MNSKIMSEVNVKLITISIMIFSAVYAVNQAPIVPDSISTQLYSDTINPVTFTVQTTDPDNENISYQFDWGDSTISNWSDFIQSGYVYSENYQYKKNGIFQCRVRVKDVSENITEWSKPFILTIIPQLLEWQYKTSSGIYSGVGIGSQQEIYLTTENGELHCVNPDGTMRWQFLTSSSIYSAPVIGKKLIYITTTDGNLYAVDYAGKEQWQYKTGNSIYSTPALGKNEQIIFGCDDGNVYTVSSAGKLLWTYKTGDEIAGSPSINSDGIVFIASDAVYALTQNGKEKWKFVPAEEDEASYFASPAINDDGTIYIGGTDGALYAITKEGRLKYRAETPDLDAIRACAVIDKNGVIYFGAENGTMYKKEVYGEIQSLFETDYYIFSSPAIDSLGNIYFVSDDGFFYCIQHDGQLLYKWQIAQDSKEMMYSASPVITDNNEVYVGSWEGNLYAFKSFAPPAKSPWPLVRYNQQNIGSKQK